MTTIATDGKSMAADGRTTAGNTVVDATTRKLHRLADGRIVGMCGNSQDGPAFLEWLRSGGDKPKLGENFGALVLTPRGRIEKYEDSCIAIPRKPPQATGSGMDFALGALDAGATPDQAVRIAAKRDIYTGGKITTLAI
jgi:ATP-dependent protease HslVU (ClpYQ) peptidase subunit